MKIFFLPLSLLVKWILLFFLGGGGGGGVHKDLYKYDTVKHNFFLH